MTEVLDRPAGAGADDDGARETGASNVLRGQYRSLQDMDSRQRAIVAELASIDQLAEPDDGDLAWQGDSSSGSMTTSTHMAAPLRKRAKDMDRVRAAHQDPSNREEPVRTPDLQTRNVVCAGPVP